MHGILVVVVARVKRPAEWREMSSCGMRNEGTLRSIASTLGASLVNCELGPDSQVEGVLSTLIQLPWLHLLRDRFQQRMQDIPLQWRR